MVILRELYAYRHMIYSLVKRDLRGRYKASVLGFLWTFINPLLQLLVYTFVFSAIMKTNIENYYLFLFVGLVPWIFFSTSISGGASCVLSQQDMVKKIYFPREVLPISYVMSQFVNMLLTFIVIFAVVAVSGRGVNYIALLYLPIIFCVEYLLALGLAMLFSALTIYFRDLEYILGIIMMTWMYLTPIIYPIDFVPEEFWFMLQLNPMTPIINAYREILFYKKIPQITTLLHVVIVGIVFLVIGSYIFSKLKKNFAEEL